MAASSSARKSLVYCFPDTNFLYHFQFFRDLDWPKLLSAKRVCVVVCGAVINELESHKTDRTSDRRRNRSRQLLKEIDRLGAESDVNAPVPLRRGTSVLLDIFSPDMSLYSGRLDGSIPDDRILGHLLALKTREPGARVVLLTDDVGMRVKARALDVEVITLPEDLRLKDEPTDSERRVAQLEDEVAAIRSAVPQATVGFYLDGRLQTEALFEWTDSSLSAGDLAMMARHRAALVIARTRRGFEWQHKDADKIREDDAVRYDTYLKQLNEYLAAASTMLKVELAVMVRGSLPGENVVLGSPWRSTAGHTSQGTSRAARPNRQFPTLGGPRSIRASGRRWRETS